MRLPLILNRSASSSQLGLLLTMVLFLGLASSAAPLRGGARAEPVLILDTTSLADDVYRGLIFAKLGDVAIFWLDEFTDTSTPEDPFDDAVRFAVWRTDGTADGTYPLLPEHFSLHSYTGPLNGVLFLVVCSTPGMVRTGGSCNSPAHLELWRTDGTQGGTFSLDDRDRRVAAGGDFVTAIPQSGKVYFLTRDSASGLELWATNGSRDGTSAVANLSSLGFTAIGGLRAWGEEVYFLGSIPEGQGESFDHWFGRTDGTAEGTSAFPVGIDDLWSFQSLEPAGETLFLMGVSAEEELHPVTGTLVRRRTLWVLERGAERFDRVAEVGYRRPSTGVHAVSGGGHLLFEFPEPTGEGSEVWVSDGTRDGTYRLGRASLPYAQGHIFTEPFSLPSGRALIALSDESSGLEPWITNGTPEGTGLLLDLCPGDCSSFPVGAVVFGGWYYFSAEDKIRGRELWRWQPVSGRAERVADLCPGECGGFPIVAEQTSGHLFVRALDVESRWRVWRVGLDGSAQEVADFGDLALGGFRLLSNHGVLSWRLVGTQGVFWATGPTGRLGLWSMEVPSNQTAPPPGPGLVSDQLPGFSVKVRITSGSGESALGRQESTCIPQTLCVSGAVPGRSEVFVRVVGPKPNGRLWPTVVKFTTSTVEVWIEQLSTSIVRYYRLEGAAPGSSELPGLFDRDGFLPGSD